MCVRARSAWQFDGWQSIPLFKLAGHILQFFRPPQLKHRRFPPARRSPPNATIGTESDSELREVIIGHALYSLLSTFSFARVNLKY